MNITKIVKLESIENLEIFGLILKSATVLLTLLILISIIRDFKSLKIYSNFIIAFRAFNGFNVPFLLILKKFLKPYIDYNISNLFNCFIYFNNSVNFCLLLAVFVHRYRLIKHPSDGSEKMTFKKKMAIGILFILNFFGWFLYYMVNYFNLIKKQVFKSMFKDILQTLLMRIPIILSLLIMVHFLFIIKEIDGKKSKIKLRNSKNVRKEKKLVVYLSLVCSSSFILWFYFVFLEPFVTYQLFFINSTIFQSLLDFHVLIESTITLIFNDTISKNFIKTYSIFKNLRDANSQVFATIGILSKTK